MTIVEAVLKLYKNICQPNSRVKNLAMRNTQWKEGYFYVVAGRNFRLYLYNNDVDYGNIPLFTDPRIKYVAPYYPEDMDDYLDEWEVVDLDCLDKS